MANEKFPVTSINEYQQLALRTLATEQVKGTLSPATVQALVQISLLLDIVGPQVEGIKKYVGQGHPFPTVQSAYGYQDFPAKELTDQQKVLLVGALGAVGEAWELFQLVAGNILSGEDLDQDKMLKEAGDGAWYAAVIAYGLGVPLSEVYGMNIAKLKKAYPNGWDSQRSINREGRD